MTAYKYVGRHLDDLHDGRQLLPGLEVDLSADEVADPHNAQRIDAGLLIPVQAKTDVDATDGAKKLAAANGVDLHDVTGTGQHGRVTQDDVTAHLANKEGND